MKKILALVLALCMVFALCACGSSSGDSDTPAASTVSLNVGTGGESGTYYGYTGILGTVIGQKTDVKLTVVATGGSKDNLVSMQDGMYDLATVQSDVMTYAYNGTNSFADSGKIDGFRVLCALYPETVQIVTTDPSLKTVEDLRGQARVRRRRRQRHVLQRRRCVRRLRHDHRRCFPRVPVLRRQHREPQGRQDRRRDPLRRRSDPVRYRARRLQNRVHDRL